jgi:serine/threonine protein kinase
LGETFFFSELIRFFCPNIFLTQHGVPCLALLLRHGYYRDVWLIPNPIVGDTDLHDAVDFVLKRTRLPIDDDDDEHMPHPNSFNKIQKEALIMERLTSSPRIVSIYGHCGLSVLAETTPDEIVNFIVPESGHANRTLLEQLPHIQSMNNYTAIEKLDIALDMSKSIADLHGFSGGKILHGDIHPVQWLRSRVDGKLKLNDFNNAEILDLNRHPADVNDTFYCKAERGIWGGSFRSPEEFLGLPIDEQIDVFSMGNNIYTLITGLVSTFLECSQEFLDVCF